MKYFFITIITATIFWFDPCSAISQDVIRFTEYYSHLPGFSAVLERSGFTTTTDVNLKLKIIKYLNKAPHLPTTKLTPDESNFIIQSFMTIQEPLTPTAPHTAKTPTTRPHSQTERLTPAHLSSSNSSMLINNNNPRQQSPGQHLSASPFAASLSQHEDHNVPKQHIPTRPKFDKPQRNFNELKSIVQTVAKTLVQYDKIPSDFTEKSFNMPQEERHRYYINLLQTISDKHNIDPKQIALYQDMPEFNAILEQKIGKLLMITRPTQSLIQDLVQTMREQHITRPTWQDIQNALGIKHITINSDDLTSDQKENLRSKISAHLQHVQIPASYNNRYAHLTNDSDDDNI